MTAAAFWSHPSAIHQPSQPLIAYEPLARHHLRPNKCTYWVDEHLLAGENPTSRNGDDRARLRAYLQAGVSSFVDLTQEGEKRDYINVAQQEARDLGLDIAIEYVRLSVPDFGVPNEQCMTSILDAIDGAASQGRKVYVHCRGGIGRTGTAVGCYLVRRGLSNEAALAQVNRLFQSSDRSSMSIRSPETNAQEEFILSWNEEEDQFADGASCGTLLQSDFSCLGSSNAPLVRPKRLSVSLIP